MSKIQLLLTRITGRKVGRDYAGNVYYESRRPDGIYGRTRRTVALARGLDSSIVPPEWHAWLHHTTAAPVIALHYSWQKPHQPNLTGTALAYRPKGHDYAGGKRPVTTGDYEAWTPGG